jgi:hypothetical protein
MTPTHGQRRVKSHQINKSWIEEFRFSPDQVQPNTPLTPATPAALTGRRQSERRVYHTKNMSVNQVLSDCPPILVSSSFECSSKFRRASAPIVPLPPIDRSVYRRCSVPDLESTSTFDSFIDLATSITEWNNMKQKLNPTMNKLDPISRACTPDINKIKELEIQTDSILDTELVDDPIDQLSPTTVLRKLLPLHLPQSRPNTSCGVEFQMRQLPKLHPSLNELRDKVDILQLVDEKRAKLE